MSAKMSAMDQINHNLALMNQVSQHLGVVADAILALTSDDPLSRGDFRACVRSAQHCITQAEAALTKGMEGALNDVIMYCLARIQLAATNLGTAVAAYRAAWAST